MGTSTSCKGGGPRSPFDPEWLDSPAGGAGGGGGGGGGGTGDGGGKSDSASDTPDGNAASESQYPPMNPARRLAGARGALSGALRGGGGGDIRSAAKRMVSRGMGGPARAARTMRATAQGAGALGQFLAQARDGSDQSVVNWVQRIRAASLAPDDLVLEVIKAVIPDSGSIDEDSLRNAAAETFSMLFETSPEVDLFNLTDQQIADVIGFTIGNDICNRVDLLLGQTYEKLKYTPQDVQLVRNEIREYVHGLVRLELDKLGPRPMDAHGLARDVLAATLEVFGE